MGRNYSSAECVWAWLGAADDTTATFTWLHIDVCDATISHSARHGPYPHKDVKSEDGGILFQKLGIFISDARIEALYRFYARRRLLNRLQEVAPGDFAQAMQNLTAIDASGDLVVRYRGGGPSDPIYRPFMEQAYETGDSHVKMCAAYLRDILTTTIGQVATDPRDKLYGILGLIQPFWPGGALPLLKPDYTTHVEQMYYNMTVWCLRMQSSMAILSLISRNPVATQSSMPRRVVNLAARSLGSPSSLQHYLWKNTEGVEYEAFCANGLRRSSLPSFRVHDVTHLAQGHTVGRITSLSVSLPLLQREAPDIAHALVYEIQLLEYMISCCIAQPTYFNGEHIASAVGGCFRLGVSYDAEEGRVDLCDHVAIFLGAFYKMAI
ncbi:hypothetical protein LTR95_013950 [Oleoguttula sp. CCFEE 5521]